jgi:phosphate-selective porin OprO and OprP
LAPYASRAANVKRLYFCHLVGISPAMKTTILFALLAFAGSVSAQEPSTQIEQAAGKGLVITSPNNQFQFWLRPVVNLQYTYFNPDNGAATNALELRRARLFFGGYLHGEHNKYFVELGFSPNGDMRVQNGTVTFTPIMDWRLEFDYWRDLTLRLGQYRVQFFRERTASDFTAQFADRSTVNAEFGQDRSIGFDFRSNDFLGINQFRYYAGIFTGEGRDSYQRSNFGFMYTARFEYLPFGLYDDYTASDMERSHKLRASFGVGYGFIHKAQHSQGILGADIVDATTTGGTIPDTQTNMHLATADTNIKWNGFSLNSAYVWRSTAQHAATVLPRNGYGVNTQMGYVVPVIPLEIAMRYGIIRQLGDLSSIVHNNELAASLTYFIHQHSLKVLVDYTRLSPNAAFTSGADQVRALLQLMY